MSDRLVEVIKPRKVYDRPRQVVAEFGPSRTKQAPAEACDVNSIMARYVKAGFIRPGQIPMLSPGGQYADVSALSGTNYGDAVAVVQRVNEAFDALPAVVRDRFKNDPQGFLAFISDPANKAECVKLGLINAPVEAPVVSEVK